MNILKNSRKIYYIADQAFSGRKDVRGQQRFRTHNGN